MSMSIDHLSTHTDCWDLHCVKTRAQSCADKGGGVAMVKIIYQYVLGVY